MTASVWRLVAPEFAATAFDGEGARRLGGRWNSPGTRVVYTAQTAVLSVLETLVHLQALPALDDYALFEATLDDGFITDVAEFLPPGAALVPALQRAAGDRWVAERSSLALRVPSAVLGVESNFLLNPVHPDCAAVAVGAPRPFRFDRRLFPAG